MFAVVGLGNPGAEYVGTRHNVGFEVVEHLAARQGFGSFKRFKSALVVRGRCGGIEVLLAKPSTFMNLSGIAVRQIVDFYRIEIDKVVVVHDDLDFDPGQVRVKVGGGHGGHNGLRSIAEHIGSDFARVRVGIGKPTGSLAGAGYVLSRFERGESQTMQLAKEQAAQAIELILAEGLARAMGRVNQKS